MHCVKNSIWHGQIVSRTSFYVKCGRELKSKMCLEKTIWPAISLHSMKVKVFSWLDSYWIKYPCMTLEKHWDRLQEETMWHIGTQWIEICIIHSYMRTFRMAKTIRTDVSVDCYRYGATFHVSKNDRSEILLTNGAYPSRLVNWNQHTGCLICSSSLRLFFFFFASAECQLLFTKTDISVSSGHFIPDAIGGHHFCLGQFAADEHIPRPIQTHSEKKHKKTARLKKKFLHFFLRWWQKKSRIAAKLEIASKRRRRQVTTEH